MGTIVSGSAYISPEGRGGERQWGVHADERIRDIELLAGAARESGAKFIVQLSHAGGQRYINDGYKALTPSGLPVPGGGQTAVAATERDIEKIRRDFAAAARRVKEGGADGVEIHGGHGFLLTQFLSPLLNKRTDKYGGSPSNRARIFLEVYRDIRAAVGESFPVWCKISAAEGCPGGYTEEDGLFTAGELLKSGIDGIEVSSGACYAPSDGAPAMVGVSAGESEAPFKAYAKELKKVSSGEQIIILTGGVRSLPVAAGLIDGGVCDLLGMSRPLISEPDLINRWYYEDSRPSACISCNACLKRANPGPVDCPVARDRNEGNWSPL